jgi:hypothetical protein
MIELEHSPLGGSAAHRFMTCIASFLLQREEIQNGTFEDVPSEFAALGVAAHELGAVCLTEGREPYEFLSEEFNGYRAGWESEINLDALTVYFNDCMKILDATASRPRELLIERTIHLPEIHPLFKGTVDFGVLSPTRLWLRDYKNGEGIGVAAPNNKQLLYYAALMIRENPHWQEIPRDMPVSLGICQPNFYGIFEDVDVWETTVGFVLDWLDRELLPRMNVLSAAPFEILTDDDHVPGDHCQFCPVLLSCVKMQRAYRTYADASEDFVTMLTNDELDELYSVREHARRFMKVLETTVLHRKLTGADIKSAKLVEKQTARVWAPGGVAAIQAAFGDKAYKPREPLSPAGVEKLSSRGKELAQEYGYKPESGGLVIAPLSDRRPEAKPRSGATVFKNFEQSPEQAGF